MKFLKPVNLYRESLKTEGPLMALSVSKKEFGLSISDASKKEASPLKTRTMVKTATSALHNLISRYSVSGLIFGYPFKRDQKLPTLWMDSRFFVDELMTIRELDSMNYTYWDDAYTAKRMFQTMKEMVQPLVKCTPPARHVITDAYAAFEILETYLDFFNRNQDQTFEGEHEYQDFGQPKSIAAYEAKKSKENNKNSP